ncbi:MAG: hypothetical protein KAX38_01810, partial [Candidatus Krumholzibacteria bacterium]|nr:hypothetical protein [Candidatus Krumholzibacteria bacterium]
DDAFETFFDMDEPGYSMSSALRHLPAVKISGDQARKLVDGVAPRIISTAGDSESLPGNLVRLIRPDGKLGAIGEVGVAGFLQIRRVFKVAGGGGERGARSWP